MSRNSKIRQPKSNYKVAEVIRSPFASTSHHPHQSLVKRHLSNKGQNGPQRHTCPTSDLEINIPKSLLCTGSFSPSTSEPVTKFCGTNFAQWLYFVHSVHRNDRMTKHRTAMGKRKGIKKSSRILKKEF